MARLLNYPRVGIVSQEPISGPETVGAGNTTSIGNFTQTIASPYGAWVWTFTFVNHRERSARALRGWAAGLNGGANATRWEFTDPDKLTPKEIGLSGKPTLSNGKLFSNGKGFSQCMPLVTVAASAAKDTTLIQLANEFYGYSLPEGSYVGFSPSHFGMYVVTEDIGYGRYRIWPPLRKAVSAGDMLGLSPVLAMRPMSKDSISIPRDLTVSEGATATLVEVFDYHVRTYFND